MNVGEFQEGMSAERRDLIKTLEALGYDAMDGVRHDWPDWRDRLSDDDMRVLIENLSTATGEEEHPDISEMVEAIREMVDAAKAYQAATEATDAAAVRYAAAIRRQEILLSQIDKAQEAFRT